MLSMGPLLRVRPAGLSPAGWEGYLKLRGVHMHNGWGTGSREGSGEPRPRRQITAGTTLQESGHWPRPQISAGTTLQESRSLGHGTKCDAPLPGWALIMPGVRRTGVRIAKKQIDCR